VRELRASPRPDVDSGAGAGGQFAVAGDEIGMQVGLDHMLDAQAVLARGFQVDFDVALRVDHRRHAFRAGHVRGVRQATEIELFKVHLPDYRTAGVPGSAGAARTMACAHSQVVRWSIHIFILQHI
jgi:hypothetical protein